MPTSTPSSGKPKGSETQPEKKPVSNDELKTMIGKAMGLARDLPSTNYDQIFSRTDRNEPDMFPEPPPRPLPRVSQTSTKKKGSAHQPTMKKNQSIAKAKGVKNK